jgi:hypothetical protein
VPTHRWYIERTVWLIAGLILLVFTTLAALDQPLWVLAIIGLGLTKPMRQGSGSGGIVDVDEAR